MLSALSKLADRSFVIGFFLPALLAIFCLMATLATGKATAPVTEMTKIWSLTDVTVVALAAWLLAVALVCLNYWLYRALEGYVGPLRSERRRKKHIEVSNALFEKLDKVFKRYEKLAARPSTSARQDQETEEAKNAFEIMNWSLMNRYPGDVHRVLPTEFGNVIVAFESYPATVYGVESITLWPRLQAVIPKDYIAVLSDARSIVDLFVNIIYLALAFVGWSIYQFVDDRRTLDIWIWTDLLRAIVAIAVACFAYRAAISAAQKWGDAVKAAFDLYLPDLANQLGYELPVTAACRRKFWIAFGRQFQQHEPVQPEDWTIRGAVQSEPDGTDTPDQSEAAGEADKEEKACKKTDRPNEPSDPKKEGTVQRENG